MIRKKKKLFISRLRKKIYNYQIVLYMFYVVRRKQPSAGW